MLLNIQLFKFFTSAFVSFYDVCIVLFAGVCMWEILSRGDKPFLGVDNAEVIERLERGDRLPLPSLCPLPVYAIMYDCWAWRPSERPSFSDISARLRSVFLCHSGLLASTECKTDIG